MAGTTEPFDAERYGLSAFSERGPEGLPLLNTSDEEELAGSFPAVSMVAGDHVLGEGTLYISTRRLVWTSTSDPSVGYAVGFPAIAMHAISSDSSAFQRPCIYTQLETARSGGADEQQDDGWTPEMRLVPSDPTSLEQIFQLMCDCAAKNPDPGQEEDVGEFFYDEEEVLQGAGVEDRAARLDHYDALLSMPRADDLDDLVGEDPGRFEDGDEDLPDAQMPAAHQP